MTWTTYQETRGIEIQRRMSKILAGIKSPTLKQIQDAAITAQRGEVKANGQ